MYGEKSDSYGMIVRTKLLYQEYYVVEILLLNRVVLLQLVIIVCIHDAMTTFIIVMSWNYSSVEGYSNAKGSIGIIRTYWYDE